MEFIKKITQTQLFKISSLNSFSVILKIGIGLITSKLLAVFVGPGGMALVGNLRNFLTSLESISTLGFQNGIIKYTAENEKNENQLKRIIATVFICLLCIAIILSCVLYFFAAFWNKEIFGNNFDYAIVFKALALALPWYATSVFMLSVINGLGQFKKVIWINIIGNAIGLLVSIIMVLHYKTLGALLSLVISPALMFFVTFYFINKKINFFKTIRLHQFDFQIIKKLSSYSLMALVSSVLGPLVLLVIRKNIIETVGLEQAGFWETIIRISSYYMLFVTTILSVYFLPKLAVAKNNLETKKVFWSFYQTILPLFIAGLVGVYFLRFFIVNLLFTNAFFPVTTLFFWQLTGDVLKVASLILGYQFFAKKLTVAFIVAELFSLTILYFSSLYFINEFGIQGIVMAQAFDNFVYLLVLMVYFRKSLF
ncbi:O-antigen translocase [Flavobacterium xinjiangense]|uniref:Polysaccharide transporter, PST family n=1 Tax=Flavobacterium xinjiangense TaxID=178356 RepID=A0A1M7P1L9_9FLAO|nr:O-antigen translocase [Flavobacterium xinjiangense]SHN10391.1 polysaccharide transporter, PST family [Flavobacterium xinjiangense]